MRGCGKIEKCNTKTSMKSLVRFRNYFIFFFSFVYQVYEEKNVHADNNCLDQLYWFNANLLGKIISGGNNCKKIHIYIGT